MEEEVKITPSFRSRVENYWYHYKWHTIVAAFLVVVITVCTLQMCKKEEYDGFVMYAGSGEISKTSSDGDISDYAKSLSSFKEYFSDVSGDGEIGVSYVTLFLPSEDELRELESRDDYYVDYASISNNSDVFKDNMRYSTYYLVFLSEDWYTEYAEKPEGYFESLEGFALAEGAERAGEYGVYLSSLAIYGQDGISSLPEDTVVCLRRMSAVASAFDKRENEEAYSAAKSAFSKIISE